VDGALVSAICDILLRRRTGERREVGGASGQSYFGARLVLDLNEPTLTSTPNFSTLPLATYDRLVGQGHCDEEVRHLIDCVVASEVVGIVNESREYDHRRYLAALEALPRLS
jgi:hypothetical protein